MRERALVHDFTNPAYSQVTLVIRLFYDRTVRVRARARANLSNGGVNEGDSRRRFARFFAQNRTTRFPREPRLDRRVVRPRAQIRSFRTCNLDR